MNVMQVILHTTVHQTSTELEAKNVTASVESTFIEVYTNWVTKNSSMWQKGTEVWISLGHETTLVDEKEPLDTKEVIYLCVMSVLVIWQVVTIILKYLEVSELEKKGEDELRHSVKHGADDDLAENSPLVVQ